MTSRLDRLSPREQEVLELIACGRSSKQIASDLGIARSTVDSYVRGILAKLEVPNRAAAAAAWRGEEA